MIYTPQHNAARVSSCYMEYTISITGGLSGKQALLDDLRLEMKVLIAAHPKGIWSADLMKQYKYV